ncbi:MAG: hypothetical protein ABEJ72_05255, partial [Candidatus Aenigmatarchaeota archaeon]
PTVKRQWKQVLGYVFIRFLLKMVAGIGMLIVGIIGFILLLIPFGLLGWGAYAVGGWLLVAPVAITGILVAIL